MARSEKEAVVLVMDVGISMSTPINGTSTYLQSCADMVQMIIQRKMFQSSKDEIGLILFGTNETANDLFEGDDHYSHIVVARPLSEVDWKLLEYVQKNLRTTNIEGDLFDALTVAADHLHKMSRSTKYSDKRIMILSDYGTLTGDQNMDDICDALKNDSIQLDIISPFDELPDEDEGDDKRHRGASNDDDDDDDHKNGDFKTQKKLMTEDQIKNQRLLKKLSSDTGGALYSFNEALSFLSLYQAKSVKSAGTKYLLDIGENFKLPIVSMIKIKENKPELFRFKKVYAKDETVELKTDRARFTKDDEQRDLDDKTEVVDAFRYGSTYVPIDDPELLRYEVEKCFSVLGFTRADNVKRYYFMGDSVQQIVPDGDDEEMQLCFKSMVEAMYEDNVYGIARKVFNKRSTPEVGCLMPYIDEGTTCLLYFELPYNDDIRKFTLESFRSIKKYKPNDLQLDLMDDLIESMDLKKLEAGDEEEEAYDPKATFNPYIQRMFQTIALKGNDSNAELPDFQNHITANYLKRFDDKIRNNSTKEVLKRCADAFPTRVIEAKKAKLDATELFSSNNGKKDDEAAADNDASDKKDMNIDDLYSSVSNSLHKVSKIGTINPVNDFNSLIESTDDYALVCDQLVDLIKQLLMESMQQNSDSYQVKAFDCIRALRETCLKKSKIPYFNKFLAEFKKYLFESTENKKYIDRLKVFFKSYFIASKLTLITQTENDASDLADESEAEQFLQLPADSEISRVEEAVEKNNEDVEDLLDLM